VVKVRFTELSADGCAGFKCSYALVDTYGNKIAIKYIEIAIKYIEIAVTGKQAATTK